MKKLVKGMFIGAVVIVGSVMLVRSGMRVGYQVYEDLKKDIIEEYVAEEKERKNKDKQYMAELLDPVEPVCSYILAIEGFAI